MSNENERPWPVPTHDNCSGYRLFARHSALHPDSHDVTRNWKFFRPRAGSAAKEKQFQGLNKDCNKSGQD